MRIFFFHEDLIYPFDEGIKKTAEQFRKHFSQKHDVLTFTRFAPAGIPGDVQPIRTNKLLISRKLAAAVGKFRPDVMVYLPSASGTPASFLRMKIMHGYYPSARRVMILLQPKRIPGIFQFLVSSSRPDLILSPSFAVAEELEFMPVKFRLMPLFTDQSIFKAATDNTARKKIRKQNDLPLGKFIILHTGHLNWGRNLEALIPLQTDDQQVLIISSTSTPGDAPAEKKLRQRLINSGIIIRDSYQEKIAAIYQACDLYVFPVTFPGGSIGLPLSILEARACGLPVVTTRFGSLEHFLGKSDKGVFFSSPDNFPATVATIRGSNQNWTDNSIDSLNREYHEVLDNMMARLD
ncbi:MAG: glycosyltransferase family 4 protein [Candidatus Cloacimonetes bacterium]|nr:glycosyltransferase family 4 protein [Candidatus Cloacimonadota bacterium]